MASERTREDADAGVMTCVRLMAEGKWISGKSHAEVAELHGVSPATVKSWATNASRILRLGMEEEAEAHRARCISTLDTIISAAMGEPRKEMKEDGTVWTVTDGRDLRVAVAAVSEKAKLLGLITHKHDVKTRPAVAHLSRKEHLEELKKLEGEIAQETQRLLEEAELEP